MFLLQLSRSVTPTARASYRDNWWVFGEPRRELRPALAGLSRVVVTTGTAKHRVFLFSAKCDLPDKRGYRHSPWTTLSISVF